MEENHYRFRMAEKQDLNHLNNLLRVSLGYWKYDNDFIDKYMELFAVSDEYFNRALKIMLMVQPDSIIGFYSFSINSKQVVELDNFYLHPDHIGKGLGRKMWNQAIHSAKSLDVKEFTLWGDPKAEDFYLKMGCKKIGEMKSPLMPNRFPPLLKYIIHEQS